MPSRSATRFASRALLARLTAANFSRKAASSGEAVELGQRVDVVEELVADRLADQLGQAADCTGSASAAA